MNPNMLGLLIFLYQATLFEIPKTVVFRINKILFPFVWDKKRERMVRSSVTQSLAQGASSSLVPSSQAFDMDLSVRLPKSAPPSSPMLTDFGRTVKQKPGKQLGVVVTNLPSPTVRAQGKSRHVSSSSEESDDSLVRCVSCKKHLNMRQRGP